ncbi:phosphatidylinositol-glycan biosynthesis class X protein-like isoform X2 [Sinocyclocheilus anshuiensis]|uniref:phosphatidylinositol-glycan biosynthesis class X protein-like isoform X2 n=1 Tax=Sinocyclocheilus anshuiensis TaxID=1608454 RepID=UPI0007B9A615|nr:PREDICTED: phosphatidylinositol-glycan biosynthesis class X protein-like isoform X2 [Sinocyclocheilus anshuiensis]
MVRFCLLATFLCFIHRGDSKEADCFPSEWFKSVSMSMKISKAGFHRDLQYSVQWSKIDHEVKALLVQQLPSGVYMDEYQLETLRRDTGLEVLLDSKVDVEAPEYLSSGFTVLVFLSGRREAAVPVHGRYHRPSASSKRVKVYLDPARLLLRSDQCRTARAGLHRVVVEAPCTFSNHSICSWTEILDLQDSGGVSLELPVADSSMLLTVCAGTVLTAVLSCVYLLRNIWKHGSF